MTIDIEQVRKEIREEVKTSLKKEVENEVKKELKDEVRKEIIDNYRACIDCGDYSIAKKEPYFKRLCLPCYKEKKGYVLKKRTCK